MLLHDYYFWLSALSKTISDFKTSSGTLRIATVNEDTDKILYFSITQVIQMIYSELLPD